MKTAILIVGHIRTWEKCKDNFIESFGHLNADIFLTTYDLQYNYHTAQKANWMVGQSDLFLSKEEILNLFEGINLVGIDYENIDIALKDYEIVFEHLNEKFKPELHTILQCRKIIRGVDLILENESRLNQKYDSIIKIRSDIHHNLFDYEIDDSNVIISNKNVFPNDVMIASNRDNFIKMTNFLKNEFFNPIYEDSHLNAPHNLFLRAFNYCDLKIEQKDSMKYVVRISGIQNYN